MAWTRSSRSALADAEGPEFRSLLDELAFLARTAQDPERVWKHGSRSAGFGVMKHLKQLEEAGLVVTRRQGREKLHFLNPVPIRLVHDRWVSKYAEPGPPHLSDLKTRLENPMEKVFEIYIRTTPERLWEAITESRDPRQVQLRRRHPLRLVARLHVHDDGRPERRIPVGRG